MPMNLHFAGLTGDYRWRADSASGQNNRRQAIELQAINFIESQRATEGTEGGSTKANKDFQGVFPALIVPIVALFLLSWYNIIQ